MQSIRPLDESVADRIEALLGRCDQLRLARDLDCPTKFDARSKRHANRIVQQDRNPQ